MNRWKEVNSGKKKLNHFEKLKYKLYEVKISYTILTSVSHVIYVNFSNFVGTLNN